MRKTFVIVILAAAVSLGGYRVVAGMIGGDETAGLVFAEVTRGDLENTVSSTGTINAMGTVEIGTQVSGTIAEVYADFNDQVRAGDLLARLDTAVLENIVQQMEASEERAEAQLAQTRIDHERNQNLFERDLLAETTVQASAVQLKLEEAALKSAQASLSQARTNLGYASIRAPIDGTVIQRDVEAGQTVAASLSTPELFVIAEDLAQVEIHALVDESDIGQIAEGQTVRFTVQAYPDDEFTGVVTQVRLQPSTVQNVVNYTVVVEADNEGGTLLPGMTATVDFIVEQRENALLVSSAALRFQPTVEMVEQLRTSMAESPAGARVAGSSPTAKGPRPAGLPMPPGGSPSSDARSGQPPADMGRVWVVDEDGSYRVIRLRTGVSDGQHTEVVDSSGLEEGMTVITGNSATGGSTNRQQSTSTGPPRGPRGFF